jgi:hypothetical protein
VTKHGALRNGKLKLRFQQRGVVRSYCKRLAPQSSSASSDQAVAVDEHLGAPSGGGGRRVEASLRPVARRRAAVAGPRAADGTTTTLAPPRWRSGQPLLHRAKRAANKSCTPYGDCFSAMAARSVGVHLSGGAILTCAEQERRQSLDDAGRGGCKAAARRGEGERDLSD